MTKADFFDPKKRFFLDRPEEMARYAASYFENEVRETIRYADEICNQRYLFCLRRDMEQTHEPVVFDGQIDWLYMPADDAEWIYAFNRHRYFISLGQAYLLTGDEKYARAFVNQLCDWIDRVKRTDENCRLAWRTIEAGLRLEYWLKAICYFKDSLYLTDEVIEKFSGSVIDHAEYLMEIYDTFRLMSNWGVLQNHGLFMAGVFLPDSERAKEYRDTAVERLTEELRIQVYSDGSHWEQSPMYHNEVLHCVMDVVILAQRNGIHLPDAFLHKVKSMCMVSLITSKPNHCHLMQGDSDDVDIRDILTKGASAFRDPILKYGGYDLFDYDSLWDLGMDALEEYIKIEKTAPQDTSVALTDSGNIYMRTDWSEDACFLHFHCGTLGAGHGHSDKLHIDLFANGEDILVDAGRFTYVSGPVRFKYKDPESHNTTTVNDLKFTVCKDSWECSKLSQPVNQRHLFTDKYDYAEGGHLGYMSLESGGVFVNRKVIYIKPDIIILVDEFYSGTPNSYQQYFHFNNSGQVTCGDRITYRSGRNHAELIFATEGVEKKLVPSKLSRHYNKEEDNICLKTNIRANGFKSIITMISLCDPDRVEKAEVRKIEVKSNFKGIVFGDDFIEAVSIKKDGREYVAVVAHQEYASPTDTFLAGGCTGFGQVVIFDRAEGEDRIGTVLKW